MQNNKKSVRAILLALNNVSLQDKEKITYNVIYEYRYNSFFNDITVNRRVIVFCNTTVVTSRTCKSDLEVINYLLEELEKFENGSIDYHPKVKKKKGRKPKNKLNQEVLTNG